MSSARLVLRTTLVGFLILGALLFWKKRPPEKHARSSFFVAAPITHISPAGLPSISVEIGEKTFSMMLDLGLDGDLTINTPSLQQISSKLKLYQKSTYRFDGKEQKSDLYQIPKVKIGEISFIKPTLQEESNEFREATSFVQNGHPCSSKDPGRIGWKLFYNANLLIDIKNRKIACCDRFEHLQGYRQEDFTKVPFSIERGLVEIVAISNGIPLRCVLDTGSTWNLLNSALPEGKALEKAIWEEESRTEYTSFKIGDRDFGPLSFLRIPIKIPIQIDAILGMEFFQEHIIFLDFAQKIAYTSHKK